MEADPTTASSSSSEPAIENKSEQSTTPSPSEFRSPLLIPTDQPIAKADMIGGSKEPFVANVMPPPGAGCTYKEPDWATPPKEKYSLEVLRNGVLMDNINLSTGKSHLTVGRLPGQCDICSEHPSSSRFHAVFQHGRMPSDSKEGFYLYDLNSTHGTFLNKIRLEPEKFVRVKVGFVVRFGSSTRLYIVQGPADEEEDDESGLTITQIKELQAQKLLGTTAKTEAEKEKEQEDTGVDWGFGPDAVDEDAEEKELGQLGSIASHDAYYTDDPKKALNAFYLREGMDMEHDIEEIGHGNKKQYHCRIPLPIDAPNGRQLVADATANRKKDALAQAILEACRLLHAQGALKGTTSIGRKHKGKNWADEDFYDSDEDTFTDRTGTVERKRRQRIERSGRKEQATETFDSLTARLDALKLEVEEITTKLQNAEKNKSDSIGQGGLDDLDNFMEAIKAGLILDPKTRIKLKQRLAELKQEEFRLIKIINKIKPLDLPPIQPTLWKTAGAVLPETGTRLKAPTLPAPAARVYNHNDKAEFVAEEEDLEEGISHERVPPPGQDGPTEPVQGSSPVTKNIEIPAFPKASGKRPLVELDASSKSVSIDAEVTRDELVAVETAVSRPYVQTAPAKKRKPDPKVQKVEYDPSDPDYAMWIPPEDQKGDGKTSLNDRLGY